MTTTVHPLVRDYLRSLERVARALPRQERDELLAEIRAHIDAALQSPDPTEADIRTVLDGLGSPAEIVRAAGGGTLNGPPATGLGLQEKFALLLLVTGMPPLLGWVVGAILLTSSPVWTRRQKLLALLVWPGGFPVASVIWLVGFTALPGAGRGGTLGAIAFFGAPIAVAAYLIRTGSTRGPLT